MCRPCCISDSGFPWLDLIQNKKDYGDDYDDYVKDRRRKLFSIVQKEREHVHMTAKSQILTGSDDMRQPQITATKPVEHLAAVTSKQVQQDTVGLKEEGRNSQIDLKVALLNSSRLEQVNPGDKENVGGKAKAVVPPKRPGPKTAQRRRAVRKKQIRKLVGPKPQMLRKNGTLVKYVTVAKQKPLITRDMEVATSPSAEPSRRKTSNVTQREDQKVEVKMTPLQGSEKSTNTTLATSERRTDRERSGDKEDFQRNQQEAFQQKQEKGFQRNQQEDFQQKQEDYKPEEVRPEDTHKREGDYVEEAEKTENTAPLVFVKEINWSQTFQVDPLDLQEQRSDQIDLNCNISGNMLLGTKDALFLVQAFMSELHKKHPG